MQRRGLAEGTVYKRQIELRSWLDHVGHAWATADRRNVDEWLDTRPLGARSRYSAISHLSAFYRWAIRDECATIDPTTAIERPKLPRRLPRPVPSSQVQRLLGDAGELTTTMLLMLDGGLRCCEVARLRWCDVDLEAGTMFVRGKGDRDRVVGLPRRLRMALYIAEAEALNEWVAGRDLTPARVSQLVGQRARDVGLVGVTAHRLRHTYATRLYEATAGDLGAVQIALGHASITNTQIYAYVDPVRAVEAARKLDAA
jgi:integrase/recombinase XerD